MPAPSSRRFSLLDAMTIVAATAIALAWLQAYLRGISGYYRVPQMPWRLQLILYVPTAVPFATVFSVVGLIFCIRHPRAPIRQLRRQPGFLAGLMVLISALAAISSVVLRNSLPVPRRGPAMSTTWESFVVEPVTPRFFLTGAMVGAAWITLCLVGRWRSPHNWIERWSQTVGWFWVAFAAAMIAVESAPY